MATNNTTSGTDSKGEWDTAKTVDYKEIKQLSEQPDEESLILDVREPNDFEAGHIPGAINLPASTFEQDLGRDEVDFVRRHGFPKPSTTQKVILYCRSGRRSNIALEICKGAGYERVRNYPGSWLEWTEKEKEKEAASGQAEEGSSAQA
ncbi:Rhodanese-like domain-containing protein [Leucosporidium creatinivorum]|uniref:Sulfurtransferase n=1 Tax=Leucosporidium creatinivorum TaxID=106004 RepID=A0A1Y2FYI0_9BASI|nr:Rhodanese-like domain-containing protein [Leucosporidium creatinivorum]